MPWLSENFLRRVESGRLGIALTGPGSWLGRAFLALLESEGALSPRSRVRLFGSSSRTLRCGQYDFDVEALSDATPLGGDPWLLLHFAFLGKERTADMSTPRFLACNEAILQDTLHIAGSARDVRLVFASSGAAYRADDVDANPYGWCKAAQERMIAEWCLCHDIPLVIPRIFNIGGPFINKVESYALSSFILSARRTGMIQIGAKRPTWRSYVHVNELLAATCETAVLQMPGAPIVFDTAGDQMVEMADLATAVTASLAPRRIYVRRAACVSEASDAYVGKGDAYRKLLARQGRTITGLERIVADTAAFLAPALSASRPLHRLVEA